MWSSHRPLPSRTHPGHGDRPTAARRPQWQPGGAGRGSPSSSRRRRRRTSPLVLPRPSLPPFLSPLRTPSALSLPFPFTLLKGASSDRQSSPPWKPINPRAFLVAATLFAAAPLIYFSLRSGLQKSGRVPLLARRTCGRGIATGPHYLMLQELHCPRELNLPNDSRIKATCIVNTAT